jgi:hypothetical protein
MKCERCGGFIVGASFFGGEIATGAWEYDGSKCLNCGSIMDPLIMRNRVTHTQRIGRRDSRCASRKTRAAAEIAAQHTRNVRRTLHRINSCGSWRW